MNPTTKDVIFRLRAAGFKRREFEARIKRHYIPALKKLGRSNPYTHSYVEVFVKTFNDGKTCITSDHLIVERWESLLQNGFGVVRNIWPGGVAYSVSTKEEHVGQFVTIDHNEALRKETYATSDRAA